MKEESESSEEQEQKPTSTGMTLRKTSRRLHHSVEAPEVKKPTPAASAAQAKKEEPEVGNKQVKEEPKKGVFCFSGGCSSVIMCMVSLTESAGGVGVGGEPAGKRGEKVDGSGRADAKKTVAAAAAAAAASVGGGERKMAKVEEPAVKEEEEAEDDDEEEFDSEDDDPDRLWCICQQPHDDRYRAVHCNVTVM